MSTTLYKIRLCGIVDFVDKVDKYEKTRIFAIISSHYFC